MVTAHTPVCPVAAMERPDKNWYAVQFHPEVMHTQEGKKMLSNFVYQVCGCSGDWKDGLLRGDDHPRDFARRWELEEFSAPCPAVWIPPSPL